MIVTMKKIYSVVFLLMWSVLAAAQCSTEDYSFGTAEFGVSPDPALGESFEVGVLGQPYEDIIHLLIPTDPGDVDSTFAGLGTIDSLKLMSVMVMNGTDMVDISTIGLDFTCNNGGDSPDPCTFLAGNQYCADLFGTPTVCGVFPLQIVIEGYLDSFIGSVTVPYVFENYTLVVECEVSVAEPARQEVMELQNVPNPANDYTKVIFNLARSGDVKLVVSNLLGEIVLTRSLEGKRGQNQFTLDTRSLNSGVYLYSITAGERKVTRRLVVN